MRVRNNSRWIVDNSTLPLESREQALTTGGSWGLIIDTKTLAALEADADLHLA